MNRARRLLSLLVVLTLLTTVAPAAAQQPDPIEFPPANAGIQQRLTSAQVLYDLPAQVADQPQILSNVVSADERVRIAVNTIAGDRITDAATYDLDQLAATDLQQAMVHAGDLPNVLAQLEAAAAALAEADRIAALREYESFLAIPADAVNKRDNIISEFERKFGQSDDQLGKGHYAQAIEKAHQAWREVNSALVAYWTANDPDGDLLPTDREIELGTDPSSADTDGDTLSDLIELLNTFTDPLTGNTYDPNVRDDQLDLEPDGLTNAEELAANTDPIEADTDGDTLLDGFEVNEFGSNPLLIDTDDDRLDDDSEHRIGTDPNNPDSDGDGILDGDESYTTTTDGPGVTLAITGVGDVAKTVTVSDQSASSLYEGAAGLLSAPVDFSTAASFDSATLTFSFDPNDVPGGDTGNVAVGFYDEEIGVLTPLPTTVDAVTGTATATTDHFTTFVLFYVPNWLAIFEGFDPGSGTGGGEDVFFDVALILDSSGSMGWNDPAGLRRVAAKNFIDGLIDGDQVAVIDFDSFAILRQALTTDFEAAKAAVNLINSSGGTNITRGVTAAHNELINNGDPEHAKVEILLTDGEGAYSTTLTQQAIDNEIVMYTIGLGNSVDAALLEGIATATGGEYFPVLTADDLPEVFDRIGDELGDKDTDEDGLLDRWEIEGMPTGSGGTIMTDPFDADSDDDGLWDGDELQFQRDWSEPYPVFFFAMRSHPLDADSDMDGMDDPLELDFGSNVFHPDQDGDNLVDGIEYEYGFDFTHKNPDGDRFEDAAELLGGTDPFAVDPSLADRTRALAAGALLGDLGYWLADLGVSTQISILWTPFPTISVGVGVLDVCRIPILPCTDLISFRPVDTHRVEYVVGLIIGGFIPLVDIAVTVRDTIGSALQGEWGWAFFELTAGLLGAGVPILGDAPNVAKDALKWVNLGGEAGKRLDDVVTALSKLDDIPVGVRARIVKELQGGAYDALKAKNMADDDILRLAKGRQSLDTLATAISKAKGVREGSGFFTSFKNAERAVEVATGGAAQQRRTISFFGVTRARVIDALEDTGGGTFRAHEVKMGDGQWSTRIQAQINKDQLLLADPSSDITDVVWHFLPSAQGNRVGPNQSLIDALEGAGIRWEIWLP